MKLDKKLKKLFRNSIMLDIGEEKSYTPCQTRFGGLPDVPTGFAWPTCEGKEDDGTVKTRPLSFLAQFNCEEVAKYDTEHLLPKKGLLSFFYDCEGMPWGFDPKDKGGARVFWFEDTAVLSAREFPAELADELRFPMLKINFTKEDSLPSYDDFSQMHPDDDIDPDEYDELLEALGAPKAEECSKLLGWADTLQESIPYECELVSRGYYLGDGLQNIPQKDVNYAVDTAVDNWVLLFQLSTVSECDFELMFGDCGSIYFYIRKEDLKARRFENAWQVLQCF